MAEIMFGNPDPILKKIQTGLAPYERDYPQAKVDLYRRNSVSVRIRIIDPSFAGLSKIERSRRIWDYLRAIPERAQSDITVLLLLTPDEAESSLANLDFEQPLPSSLL